MEVEYSSYSWCILGIIFLIAMINEAERFSKLKSVISFVSNGSNMLDDTNTNNIEYGVLTGAAFLLVYGIASLPMVKYKQGRWADTTKHPKLFLISMSVLWNVASACTAFATDFATLLWPRVLFGVFSSALDPAALRLASKYFPTWRRGFATGLFVACLYLGGAISSICLVIAQAIGWRYTYVLMSIVGVVITVIVGPFIRSAASPPKISSTAQGYDQLPSHTVEAPRPLKEDLKELFKNKTLNYINIIGFFRFAALYGRTFFEPDFFSKAYPSMKTTYAYCNAGIVICAILGPILGGDYTDKREAQNPKIRPLVCW